MFDIVAGSHNNVNWVEPWIISLENTLADPNRQITIYDTSSSENRNRLRKICSKSNLNIRIKEWDLGIPQPDGPWAGIPKHHGIISKQGFLLDYAALSKLEYVCLLDVDLVFLLKDWDLLIENQLKEGYQLIASATRFLDCAETLFLITTTNLITTSQISHKASAPEWDKNIFDTSIEEHSYMTYMAHKLGYKIKLITEQVHPSEHHGEIIFYDGKELAYHNYYSSRVYKESTCPVPIYEQHHPVADPKRVKSNAKLLKAYASYVWPKLSLQNYLRDNPSIPPPTILQIELTKNCNNACIMCHKGQLPPGQDFNRADISDIVLQQVKPVYPYLRYAMLFGDGEPMMFKGFWNTVQEIREASPYCAIDFINNGSQMNKLNAHKCLEYKISRVGLSLGGATPQTHNKIRKLSDLEQVIKNFEYLQEIKNKNNTNEPYVSTLIVVMKSNMHELVDFIHLANRIGCFNVSFQKLFVTHPMVLSEVVSDDEVKPIFQECADTAEELGVGLSHYLNGVRGVSPSKQNINYNDLIFSPHYDKNIQPKGYCQSQQPWNSVYVLHSGIVVPDCHWWYSNTKIELNECGTLDQRTNIFDIWNGRTFNAIRDSISEGIILPQCRGCGLAGGVKDEFRSKATDHTSPIEEQCEEKLFQVTLPTSPICEKSTTSVQQEIYKSIFKTDLV